MDGRARIIHTAQALVDEVFLVPDLPRRGGNVYAQDVRRYAASAVNILLAAARSGATCVLAGSVGTGERAQLIRQTLADESISISSPPILDTDSGVCVVLLEPTAERTFVTTWGAERQITPQSLATSAPVVGDLVCVSGYSLLGPTCEPLLQWLTQLPVGIKIVLDPGAALAEVAGEVSAAVLARTAVWTSNLEEVRALTGLPEADMVLGATAAAEYLPREALIVVRDGPNGCAIAAPGQVEVVAGFPQEPLDSNGAGDCHTGVLLAGLAAGLSAMEAAQRANAAAAIKVTRWGPSASPTLEQIDAFLAAQGI